MNRKYTQEKNTLKITAFCFLLLGGIISVVSTADSPQFSADISNPSSVRVRSNFDPGIAYGISSVNVVRFQYSEGSRLSATVTVENATFESYPDMVELALDSGEVYQLPPNYLQSIMVDYPYVEPYGFIYSTEVDNFEPLVINGTVRLKHGGVYIGDPYDVYEEFIPVELDFSQTYYQYDFNQYNFRFTLKYFSPPLGTTYEFRIREHSLLAWTTYSLTNYSSDLDGNGLTAYFLYDFGVDTDSSYDYQFIMKGVGGVIWESEEFSLAVSPVSHDPVIDCSVYMHYSQLNNDDSQAEYFIHASIKTWDAQPPDSVHLTYLGVDAEVPIRWEKQNFYQFPAYLLGAIPWDFERYEQDQNFVEINWRNYGEIEPYYINLPRGNEVEVNISVSVGGVVELFSELISVPVWSPPIESDPVDFTLESTIGYTNINPQRTNFTATCNILSTSQPIEISSIYVRIENPILLGLDTSMSLNLQEPSESYYLGSGDTGDPVFTVGFAEYFFSIQYNVEGDSHTYTHESPIEYLDLAEIEEGEYRFQEGDSIIMEGCIYTQHQFGIRSNGWARVVPFDESARIRYDIIEISRFHGVDQISYYEYIQIPSTNEWYRVVRENFRTFIVDIPNEFTNEESIQIRLLDPKIHVLLHQWNPVNPFLEKSTQDEIEQFLTSKIPPSQLEITSRKLIVNQVNGDGTIIMTLTFNRKGDLEQKEVESIIGGHQFSYQSNTWMLEPERRIEGYSGVSIFLLVGIVALSLRKRKWNLQYSSR